MELSHSFSLKLMEQGKRMVIRAFLLQSHFGGGYSITQTGIYKADRSEEDGNDD